MTPSSLFENTLAAASTSRLTEMHQELVKLQNVEKALIETHTSDLSHLRFMKSKNEVLEKDMLRLKYREAIYNNIQLLKAQIPLVQYTDSKTRCDESDVNYKKETENYQKAKEEAATIKALLE